MKPLEGAIALVTGATRGLGKGIAVGLGEAGATVYITGRTVTPASDSTGSLEETAVAVEQAGGVAIALPVDHSDDDQVKALFEQIQTDQGGQLDLLVNNAYAGVPALRAAYGKPFWEAEPAAFWDACNDVGLRSHYVASVYAARLMVPRQRGLICTLSSWGGLSYIFGGPYGVGKAGCDRMAADMAVELKKYQVASLSIWPGIVATELMTQFAAEMGLGDQASDAQAESGPANYNWETPLLTGRVIAALAADPNVLRRTGQVQIVAELAREYRAVDADGQRPASLRSLRFVLPYAVPGLRQYAGWVPDLEMPWPLLLLGPLGSPKA